MLALILLWTRHTKPTCVGNVGFDGFKTTITTKPT